MPQGNLLLACAQKLAEREGWSYEEVGTRGEIALRFSLLMNNLSDLDKLARLKIDARILGGGLLGIPVHAVGRMIEIFDALGLEKPDAEDYRAGSAC